MLPAGITVKRLQHLADGSILLKSDNPAYEADRLPKDDGDELKIIGRVGLVLQAI
jgi:phage repressor protein C with HTH and peptisase S24 domain